MNFTTLANVQKFLNKSSLTVAETATITMLIDMVDAIIKNYCRWEILAKDYTKVFDGDGSATLDLRITPINTVAELLVSDTDLTDNVSIASEDGAVYFEATDGNTFTSGSRNIQITFNAGHTEVPNDLAYAASWLAAINFNRIASENIGISSEEFQGVKAEYDKVDIPVMVKHVLDQYKYLSIY